MEMCLNFWQMEPTSSGEGQKTRHGHLDPRPCNSLRGKTLHLAELTRLQQEMDLTFVEVRSRGFATRSFPGHN